MFLGKNQKLILNLLQLRSRIRISEINIKNYSAVDLKRIIDQMENKGLIEKEVDKIRLKNNVQFNFLKEDQRKDFYQIISKRKLFKTQMIHTKIIETNQLLNITEEKESIKDLLVIDHSCIYKKFFDYCWNNNDSLNDLKRKDLKQWKRLYKSGLERMNYQIEETQRKINRWSNNKYKLVYEINSAGLERLYLERNNSRVKLFNYSKKEILNRKMKEVIVLEYELVFMIYSLINELLDISYSSKLNYSHLSSNLVLS